MVANTDRLIHHGRTIGQVLSLDKSPIVLRPIAV